MILALSRPTSAELLTLTARCREAGIRVSLVPQPYELYFSKPVLLDLDGLPLLQLNDPIPSHFFLQCKRSIDLALGAALSLLAIPIVLPVAAILRASKGRAFSWDTRCGQHGHPFEMLRLNIARRAGNTTPFEKLLEGLSITELPQLWNVLRGQMSLIGPRPESPNRAKRYTDWQQRRLSVKPGITGLAQVHGLRDYSSSEDKTRYDLQYLLYPSLLVDISLLLQTIWTLVLRVGRAARFAVPREANTSMTSNVESTLSEEVYSVAHRSQPGSDQLRWRRD